MESLFLNRNAFTNNFGNIPSPIKHFKLNRNAKSVALRTELLQKGIFRYICFGIFYLFCFFSY